MYVLFIFGEYVESVFLSMFGAMKGRLFYLMLYLFTIIASSIPPHFKHKDNAYYSICLSFLGIIW